MASIPKTVAVIGLGYVGLSNAVLLAQHNKVMAVDILEDRVAMLNVRQCPIDDTELAAYLATKDLDLTATTDLEAAVAHADFAIIASPTNYDPVENFFDTSSVETIARAVIEANPDTVVVIKSTIPVGFVRRLREMLDTDRIFFSPEFLREGQALHDNLHPSRIVVGERSERARDFADLLLEGSATQDAPILFTNPDEAEAIKLFANTYLLCGWRFSTNSTAMPCLMVWIRGRSSRGLVSTRASGRITITHHLATVATACPKIPSNFWQIILRCRRI